MGDCGIMGGGVNVGCGIMGGGGEGAYGIIGGGGEGGCDIMVMVRWLWYNRWWSGRSEWL